MGESQSLTWFIGMHERKLQAKIDAVALGRRVGMHQQPVGDSVLKPLSNDAYQSVLAQPFATVHEKPPINTMRYVVTSRHSSPRGRG